MENTNTPCHKYASTQQNYNHALQDCYSENGQTLLVGFGLIIVPIMILALKG